MASITTAEHGDGFLSQRLERALDMDLRRFTAIRDWILGITVVCLTLMLQGVEMAPAAFVALLVMALTITLLLIFLFPRLPQRQALQLEKSLSFISSFGLLGLVAATGGASSPYVYFFALSIVFAAAFVETRISRFVLIGTSALCALAPLAYDWQEAAAVGFVSLIVSAVAFWLAAAVLVALKRDSAVAAEHEARRVAYVDSLTGAGTRRVLEEFAERLESDGVAYSVAWVRLLDMDEINRSRGHIGGDEALVRTVSAMRAASLERDQVARLGGVEFAVILPEAGLDCAEQWGVRFRERLTLETALAGDQLQLAARVGAAAGGDLDRAITSAQRSAVLAGERPAGTGELRVTTEERAEHLRAQLDRATDLRTHSAIESFDAPSGVILAILSSALITLLIAVDAGASSIFLSAAVLQVAWFGCFGTRIESRVAAILMGAGVIGAVVANAPVSAVDLTRTLSILASMALLADTVQKNARKLSVAERRAAELSLVDDQTGLGNSTAFERTLARMLAHGTGASRVDRLEGRPAVLSIELSDSLDRDQLVAAACALRDAIGSSGSVYRVGVSDFAVITRAHHEHFLADLIASCQSALIDDELLRSGGAMVGASRFGGAIHDGVMSAAELAGQAVMSRPQSGAADDREYALH